MHRGALELDLERNGYELPVMPRDDGDRVASDEDEGAQRGRRMRKADGEGAVPRGRDRGPIATAGSSRILPAAERGGMKSRKRSLSHDGEVKPVRRTSPRKRSLDGPRRPASENDASLGESWVVADDVSKLRGLSELGSREPRERRGRRAKRPGSDTSGSRVSWKDDDTSAADDTLASDDSKASKRRSRQSSVRRGDDEQEFEADLRELRKQRKRMEEQEKAMIQQKKHMDEVEKRLEERMSQKSKSSPGRSAASSRKSAYPIVDPPRPAIDARWQKPHERRGPDLPAPPVYKPVDEDRRAEKRKDDRASEYDIATPREEPSRPAWDRGFEFEGTAESIGFREPGHREAGLTLKEIKEKHPEEWKMFCDDKKNKKGLKEYLEKQRKEKQEKMFEEHKEVLTKVKGVLGAKEPAADGPEDDKEVVADADRVAALEEQLKLMVRIHQESEDERVALQFARE